MLIKTFQNKRGISLPMVIGLVSLLLLISVGANELILRTISSAQKIEASDKAYFSAEAGIEDALYELSPHFAGYRTPDLKTDDVRTGSFDEASKWNNQWTTQSHGDTCTGVWGGKHLCGRFYKNQKLIISLFNDDAYPDNVSANAISVAGPDINTININRFFISFRLSASTVEANSLTELTINNDGDSYVNEDGKVGFNSYSADNACAYLPLGVTNEDDDCDGRENEDSPQDPVIYWKISDNAGNTFVPARGCSTAPDAGSEICEMDFKLIASELLFTLDHDANGVCEGIAGGICDVSSPPSTIFNFLKSVYSEDTTRRLQIEFNIVAPLEHTDSVTLKKIAIPYFEYGVAYEADDIIPTPYFTIKSDGYFRDFKQSITATVSPKTSVPLFDFTIIQQQ